MLPEAMSKNAYFDPIIAAHCDPLATAIRIAGRYGAECDAFHIGLFCNDDVRDERRPTVCPETIRMVFDACRRGTNWTPDAGNLIERRKGPRQWLGRGDLDPSAGYRLNVA